MSDLKTEYEQLKQLQDTSRNILDFLNRISAQVDIMTQSSEGMLIILKSNMI